MSTRINPELLSTKPTHRYNGIAVKVFTLSEKHYTLDGQESGTAEIMEGPDAGKWTTVIINNLFKIEDNK